MSTHTKGSWLMLLRYVCNVQIRQTGGGAIAEVVGDERMANARLIKSLPTIKEQRDDLLAACEELLREFVPSRDKFTSGTQIAAFNHARAAIKKAK